MRKWRRDVFARTLLFRLNTVEIRLPPLRDRIEDIPVLAEHFLRLHRERYRRPIIGFTPEALSALRHHLWPGNVRELDHVIERAVLMSYRKHRDGFRPGARSDAGCASCRRVWKR